MGEQLPEDDPADEPLRGPARAGPLDLRAGALDELAELDAGRACRLAGAAVEALVDVVVVSGAVRVEPAVEHVLHQPDAPARRVHLDAEERVRRAGRQAEAAVHAARDELVHGRVAGPEQLRQGRAHTAERPGSSTPRGSKASFTRLMRKWPAGSASPRAEMRPTSDGARRSARAPPPSTRADAMSAAADAATVPSSPRTCTSAAPEPASATSRAKPSTLTALSANAACAASGRTTRTSAPSVAVAGSSRSDPSSSSASGTSSPPASRSVRSTTARSPAAPTTSRQSRPARSTTSALGRSEVRTIAAARAKADPASGHARTQAARADGSGRTLNVASTRTPRVPNDPTSSLFRSYPATFFTTRPPARAIVPSASAVVLPMRRSRTVP